MESPWQVFMEDNSLLVVMVVALVAVYGFLRFRATRKKKD